MVGQKSTGYAYLNGGFTRETGHVLPGKHTTQKNFLSAVGFILTTLD